MKAKEDFALLRRALPLAFLSGALFLATALPAAAQVAVSNAWTNLYSGAGTLNANTIAAGNATCAAGTSRLFLVVAVFETDAASTLTSFTASFGGTAMTPVATTAAQSGREHAGLWYFLNAQIPSGAQPVSISYDIAGTTAVCTGIHVKWASYSGVDQASPVNDFNQNYNGAATVTFGAQIDYLANGVTFYASGNGGSPATHGPPAGFSSLAGVTTNGHSSFIGQITAVPHGAAGNYAGTTTVTYTVTTSARSALVVASLRPGSTTTTTLGNGTAPTTTGTLCPGGALTDLNAFTFQTNSGTNQVTDLTVTLTPAGSFNNVGTLAITDDGGTLTYGSVTNPASDTPVVTLSTNALSATTTLTQFHIRLQPKAHAAMPAVPGASYATQGIISAFTCTNGKAGSNTAAASATLTLDNLSPANAAWGTITPSSGQVALNWTNPADTDFSEVMILRKAGSAIADVPVEGTNYTVPGALGASTIIYAGTVSPFVDTGLTNGTAYYYKIIARDTCVNWSAGAASGPHTPSAPVLTVTPGAPSATVDSCSQITVSAPYTGDSPVSNSTTTFRRGPSATGPWTDICAGVTGANPRTCVSGSLAASTTYYYQVEFYDADGVLGANPQVVGPLTTPACVTNNTTAGTASATATGCTEITVTAPFTGDADGDGSVLVQYNTTNTWPGTTACAAVTGTSPRICVISGLAASTAYYVRVTYSDPDGVAGTTVQVLPGTYPTPACGADAIKPVVTMLTPAWDALVSGADTFKVQVFDGGGMHATTPLQWSADGGVYTTVPTPSATYSCGANCKVYELGVPAQSTGAHFVTILARDAAGNTTQINWPFQARGTAVGAGDILRRSSGSQLCLDCHNLKTHNAQYTTTKYGSWAIDCLTCHTPHKTANIYLVKEQIRTPNSGSKAITFRVDDRSGGTTPQNSYLGAFTVNAAATPTDDGVCEACHTKTSHYRNDTSGTNDHSHNRSQRCVGCHDHANGFGADESSGCTVKPVEYARCSTCHPAIWSAMSGATAKNYKHTLGATVGTNDSCTDSGLTWASPLNGNAAAARSCVNMCHQDHVHNTPGGTTHDHNAHQDATSTASRAVTRDASGAITAGTPARTDFVNSGNGGMCLSCHRFPIEPGAAPAHPAIAQAGYSASAHNRITTTPGGAWTYTQHDGSTFDRNCTKCHTDRADSRPGDNATPFGTVHFSNNPSLLAGNINPAATPAGGDNGAANYICYNCHGNGTTTGMDYSGKNIAAQVAKAYRHPTDSDSVHNSVTEFNGAAFGNTLGVTGRHVNCMDCHDTHETKAGSAVSPGNLAGPPLEGAWGAQLTANPAFWSDTATGNFTKKTIVAGTDLEATLCFKCHTRYYWGSSAPPTSPSGGFAETDVAKEFNPANAGNFAGTWASGETAGGFHPVLATAGSNLGRVATANLTATGGITWGAAGANLMSCTDCHESNSTADPNGPHGSTARFLLRGPNTTWSAAVVQSSSGMPAGTFCINCHSQTFASTRFSAHYSRSDHRVACWNCHAAIPHGGPRPGMLIAPAGANANVGGTIAGWDTTAPYWGMGTSSNKLYIVSYPTNNTSGWGQSNCGCNGTGH